MEFRPAMHSIVLITSLLALPVAVTQAAQPGVYFGAGIGQSDDEILDETDSGFKFFGGVNFNPNIGLELSYVDLGSFVNGALEQDGVAYEILGYLPLSQQVDLFGRAGFFNWEVADAFTSNTGTDLTFGVGINAMLSHHVSVRGEWQTFLDVDGGDVDLYSASISLHF